MSVKHNVSFKHKLSDHLPVRKIRVGSSPVKA